MRLFLLSHDTENGVYHLSSKERRYLFSVLRMSVNDVFTATEDDLRAMLPAFLAMFHTVFNLINTILFFPFVRKYAAFIEHIVPEKKGYESGSYHFSYIANTRMDTPEIYLLTVGEEVQKMGKLAYSMFSEYSSIYASDEDIGEYVHDMKEKEEYADQMQEQLINFSVRLLQDAQTPTNASRMNRMIRNIASTATPDTAVRMCLMIWSLSALFLFARPY